MRRILIIILLSAFIFSQDLSTIGTDEENNFFEGGFGITSIDGKTFTTFTLTPELSFGKFGAGLNVELLFNNEDGFKFRDDAYKSGAGWLRVIRYLRYGKKGDEFYTRVGTIDNGLLGNGFLMFHYSNESNYDQRKLGLQLDIDFEDFGFESLYSNFGRPEILGLRGYYRPLAQSDIPIVNTMEVGLSYVTDMYNVKRKILGTDTTFSDDDISALGLDISFRLLDMDYLKWKLYYDFASINNYGSGSAVGSSVLIPEILGLFEFGAKYEIRWLGDDFTPNLFNANYERLRQAYEVSSYIDGVQSTSGHFSELALSVLNMVTVRGNYSLIHGNPEGGIFHADLSVPDIASFHLGANYTKVQLAGIDEAFTLDPKAVAEFELGYQLNAYLFLTTVYRYNWVEVVDETTGLTEIKEQKRIIPQLKFRFNF